MRTQHGLETPVAISLREMCLGAPTSMVRGSSRGARWLREFLEKPNARGLLWGLVGVLLTTLVGFLAVAIFGQVAGEEFSPDLVERRSFSYLELPLLKIQLTPIDHVSTTGDLEQFLVSRKFVTIPPSAKNSPRWHLVRMRTGRERLGDAQILCEYLDHCVVGKSPYWKHWSLDHAPLAQKLWPAVFSAARQELYSFIPDLFATTNGVTDPDVLQRLLDRTFATRFAELAEWHQTHGDDATAIEIFTAGLKHAPDDPRLLRGRAASNDRLRKK